MVAATLHRDLPVVPGGQGLNQLHWLQATVALLDRGEGKFAAFTAASQRLLNAAVERSIRAVSSALVGGG